MATRERSPNYPAHSLPEAIEFVRSLYQAEKRASIPADAAARALGYTSLSGRARVKLSSMRKYGLVVETQGRFRVSDDAMRILFEKSPEDRQDALNVAAFRPDIFRALADNEQASDKTLENDLVRDGFSLDGARSVVASFRETMKVVSASPIGYDDAESEDEPMVDAPVEFTSGSAGPGLLNQRAARQTPQRPQHVFVFTPPGGQPVEVRIGSGSWTPAAQAILKSHFDLVQALVAADAAATAPSDPSSEPPQPSEQSPAAAQD